MNAAKAKKISDQNSFWPRTYAAIKTKARSGGTKISIGHWSHQDVFSYFHETKDKGEIFPDNCELLPEIIARLKKEGYTVEENKNGHGQLLGLIVSWPEKETFINKIKNFFRNF